MPCPSPACQPDAGAQVMDRMDYLDKRIRSAVVLGSLEIQF
jgi:hypothetical protein